MQTRDLGLMPYHRAWTLQEQVHQQVMEGGEETLLLVEHPAVVTLGRRPDTQRNLLTPPEQLSAAGVELVQSDRGGDITLHNPGQLVAYPIIRLADHHLSISGYVHRLEAIVIAMLAELEVRAFADPAAVGVWVSEGGSAKKICAIGVRIRRGVTLHGLALNVNNDLAEFDHIIPCGLTGRGVTSLRQLLDDRCPSMADAKRQLVAQFQKAFDTPTAARYT